MIFPITRDQPVVIVGRTFILGFYNVRWKIARGGIGTGTVCKGPRDLNQHVIHLLVI